MHRSGGCARSGPQTRQSVPVGRKEIGVDVYWRRASMLREFSTKTWSNRSRIRRSALNFGMVCGQVSRMKAQALAERSRQPDTRSISARSRGNWHM